MKTNKTKLVLLVIIILHIIPFFVIPEKAILISATSALILSITFVFYQAALIFFDKSDDSLAAATPMGLPGEKRINSQKSETKKHKQIINQNLPGAINNKIDKDYDDFEIVVETVRPAPPLVEVNKVDEMRSLLESIEFWDNLSFYKIKDSEIYNSVTVKMIGELYDYVFSGLSTYLQRYKLSIEDIINEDIVVKEYSETYSSVVFGFIVSLIEKEVAVSLRKQINRTEITIPKIKTKNPELARIIQRTEFKSQILLIIRKFYESKKQD